MANSPLLLVDGTDSLVNPVDVVTAVVPFAPISRRSYVAVSDANYSAAITDTYIGFRALTAPRTVTLPAASTYPQGQSFTIADESGNCSTPVPITIAISGSDTIAGSTSVQMSTGYLTLTLHSNGTNLWTVAGTSTAQSAVDGGTF